MVARARTGAHKRSISCEARYRRRDGNHANGPLAALAPPDSGRPVSAITHRDVRKLSYRDHLVCAGGIILGNAEIYW